MLLPAPGFLRNDCIPPTPPLLYCNCQIAVIFSWPCHKVLQITLNNELISQVYQNSPKSQVFDVSHSTQHTLHGPLRRLEKLLYSASSRRTTASLTDHHPTQTYNRSNIGAASYSSCGSLLGTADVCSCPASGAAVALSACGCKPGQQTCRAGVCAGRAAGPSGAPSAGSQLEWGKA